MVLRARLALDDCRGAIREMHLGVQGSEWRRRWIAAVALLRAVGYVLLTVDARQDEKLGALVAGRWELLTATWPRPEIFWQFIEEDRALVLKEYEVRPGQGVRVDLGHGVVRYDYLISQGPFAGRDQREVLAEAVLWWDAFLRGIEAEYDS
jgi:hypothetical protein